jgi:diguanylate cyclase (GGDEF)-like protein/PAS domain S-box-containing protein
VPNGRAARRQHERRERASLLERVRRLFLVFSLVGLGVLMLVDEGARAGLIEQAALAIIALALVALTIRQRPGPIEDLALASALLTIALVHDGRTLDLLFSAAFLTVTARALYGSRGGVYVAALTYVAILEVNQVLGGGWAALLQADGVIGQVGMLLPAWAMSGLVRVLRAHEERVRYERVLQEIGSELLSAGSRDAVYRQTLDALGRLVRSCPDSITTLWKRNGEGFDLVAGEGQRHRSDFVRIELADVAPELRTQLEAGESVRLNRAGSRLASLRVGARPSGFETLGVPVMQRGEVASLLAIGVARMPDGLADAVSRLATTTALALERTDAEALLGGVLHSSSDTIALIDLEGRFQVVTPSVHDTFGFSRDELVGLPLDTLLDAAGAERVLGTAGAPTPGRALECRARHADGSWREVEITSSALTRSDLGAGLVLVIRDVTERRALQAEIAYRAYHDPLTGFANRALFSERLDRALRRAARTGSSVAIAFLDIDDFKMVNDSLGHLAGDELLSQVAERVRSLLRDVDTAARFGGDEFALLLEDVADVDTAIMAVERVLDALRAPCTVGGREMVLGISTGLRVVDGASDISVDDLLRDADLAMYQAKATGKDHLEVYAPSMHSAAMQRLELRADLRAAAERGEFAIAYQPIVSVTDGQPVGVEALLRWHHPERGILCPADFIAVAEELGVLVPVGRWLIGEVCRQVIDWDVLHPDLRLTAAVNLSARQLADPLLCHTVQQALATSGLEADRLVLEITEEIVRVDRNASAAVLGRLRALGVRLAIDDFGEGYSSLGYLRTLPIDILKIDKSFIDDCADGGKGGVLTQVILTLAHRLDLTAVAEGIERGEQVAALAAWGCPLGQGFHFARPLEAEDFARYLLDPSSATNAALQHV